MNETDVQIDRGRPRRILPYVGWVAASGALSAMLLGSVPTQAFADVLTGTVQSAADVVSPDADPHAWADGGAATARAAESLPAKFDLRTEFGGATTPVKFQNPWGTCWAFATISASETSIRAEAYQKGISLSDDLNNLSELHLAWFTNTPLTAEEDPSQAGEGMAAPAAATDPNQRLHTGGLMVQGTSLFSSGIGPVPESLVPYQGKNGKIDYSGDVPFQYSPDDDWSVDNSLRFKQSLELEESFQLPSPGDALVNEGEAGLMRANNAIKEQLYAGRGVSIAFAADQSQPNQITETGYMNPGDNATKTWAHYTYEDAPASHAVTIVGWDDNYSKDNFGNADSITGEVDPTHRPAGDGAWIVKNSWGSDDEFPNGYPGGWGTDDDGDGGGDGYFYLSYYDPTICAPEAFDFDVESATDEPGQYYVNQYDYMPAAETAVFDSTAPIKTANIFSAEGDQTVKKVTCETARPDTHVTIDVYLLEEGASEPDEGVKLATVEGDFEYGGFHAIDLTEDQQFTLSKGERFSLVMTQQLPDGSYIARWDATLSKSGLEAQRELYMEEYYDMYFALFSDQVKGEKYLEKYQEEYDRNIAGGMTEDEAAAAADEVALPYVETDEVKAQIAAEADKRATEQIESQLSKTYGKGVVNPGESFMYTIDEETEEFGWGDWSDVVEPNEANGVAVDNFAIKAYGYQVEDGYNDPAREESLQQLEDYVADGQDMLASAVASTDGSDVPTSALWVPTDVYAELQEALMEAEDVLAEDAPVQGVVDRVSKALTDATTAFEAARQPGTAAEGLYATAEQLKEFEDAVKDARNDLQNTVVSADGKDVPKGTAWVDQATHDAFETAIESAEQALSADQPLAVDIENAQQTLVSARAAFDDAKADGLKDEGAIPGEDPGSKPGKDPDTKPAKKPSGGMPQTGDSALVMAGFASLGGVGAVVAGAWGILRKRGRK